MLFKSQAEKDFQITAPDLSEMDAVVSTCANIYAGRPPWVNGKDGVKTINFAKSLCSETARLTTLAIGVTIDGSARAEWLQQQIDKSYFQIRHWVEYGCAYGTVYIKPNGQTLDVFTPGDVLLVDYDNLGIKGIIFKDTYTEGKLFYTRLEYHRFIQTENEMYDPYIVSNRAYVSRASDSIGNQVPLEETRWAGLVYDTEPLVKTNGTRLDGPLFGMFRTPQANNVDMSVPTGLPIFREAIEELKDLDTAYSRNAGEIFDSEKIILADDRMLFQPGTNLKSMTPAAREERRKELKLPHYVKNVFGNDDANDFYQEINPQLNTDVRLAGINALLSQIGYKAGYSNGYFTFNEKSGVMTATQVESDDRRTIQLIKDVRDKLEDCLNGVIYALDVFANLYGLAPIGHYKVNYDFGDITYNREEDRIRWWQYVTQNKVPAWKYFVKFEGMSEEEAKAMVEEAQPKEEPGLFTEE